MARPRKPEVVNGATKRAHANTISQGSTKSQANQRRARGGLTRVPASFQSADNEMTINTPSGKAISGPPIS